MTIKDFDFAPATVTVNVGDTVTWTNQGPTAHSATANDGQLRHRHLRRRAERLAHLRHGRTFAYICTPHPFMKGTVVVQAASTGGVRRHHRRLEHPGTDSPSTADDGAATGRRCPAPGWTARARPARRC